MSLLSARIITVLLSLGLAYGLFSPLGMACYYIFFRPLLQPFSTLRYMLAGPVPLNGLFSIGFIFFAGVGILFRRSASFFAGNAILLYLLLLSMLLSLFFSIYPVGTISALSKIITAIAFYLVVFNSVQNEDNARRLLLAIMLSSIIPMLFGYYQFVTGTGHAWKGDFYAGDRIDSVLGQYNEYGIYLVSCLVSSLLYFLTCHSRKARIITLFIITSQIVSILLSKNRGTWIALAFAFVVTGTIFFRRINKKLVIPLAILVVALAMPLIIERFQELHAVNFAGNEKNTFAGRVEIWTAIVPLALQKPLTGWGLGSTPLVMEKYYGTLLFPHNDYLLLVFETGFVTLFVFILYLLAEYSFFVQQAMRGRSWQTDFAALTLLLYYSVISLTQNIIFNQVLFPLLLGSFALMRRYSYILANDTPEECHE